MECQVNVASGGGDRIEGEFKGKHWHGWTDGLTVWKAFRIPWNASTDPNFEDGIIKWDLAKSVSIDFTAGAKAYIYEPNIFEKNDPDWERYQDTVWSEILSMGTMSRYNQAIKFNVNNPRSR